MNERKTDFDTFWGIYPRRVGKLAAQKAYAKARTQASAQEILDGIARYIAHKPEYADFCHPATWLNQGRWMDEYGVSVSPAPPKEDWYDECGRLHNHACNGRYAHGNQMAIDAIRARERAAS